MNTNYDYVTYFDTTDRVYVSRLSINEVVMFEVYGVDLDELCFNIQEAMYPYGLELEI